jgi:transglutaminase-like putative cysteine protease
MPYRRRFPVLLLALLAVLAAAALPAALPAEARGKGDDWDIPAFSADPAALLRAAGKAAGNDGADGTDGDGGGVEVLLSEARYEYDDAGREVYTYRLLYRITDASADESWSSIEEHWSPWHQERPRLRARVITADGTVHTLDPATIAENGEAAESSDMYEDGRVLRAPLPATGAGAVVEQEVQVRETAPFFAGGVVHFRVLPMTVPVRLARLVLEAPAALPLRWISRLLPGGGPRDETLAGRRRLTFVYRDLAAYEEPEPGLPPEAPRAPYVAFSTGRSWTDLAQRYSAIVDQAIRGSDVSAFLRAAQASPAAKEGDSQLELIERLLARLAGEVRYTGIELGDGGLVPRPPADTLRRKFGDCKDKAVLLTALLRAADIPAYVALLDAGEDEQDVEPSLPGFGSFNHAIVVVPGHPALWIDPTDPFARAGELPVADQGRWALIASPTATGLVHTPESAAADNREQAVREIDLADLGTARVVETARYWGETERALRAYYAAEEKAALRDGLTQYMRTTYRAAALTGFESSPANDLSQPFRLRLEAAKAGRGVTDIADAAVAIFPSDLLDSLPDDLAPKAKAEGKSGGTDATTATTATTATAATDSDDPSPSSLAAGDGESADEPRLADYLFTRPFQVETVYRIVPPPGFAPQPLPASRVRRLGPATLSEEYAASPEGIVTATLRFDVGKRRLTAQEYAALRAGARAVAEDKPVLLLFEQVGESHLAAGRVREAIAEFSRLAAAASKKALPRTRIARALLAGGMGEAARQEAEAAVQLEPKLAVAYRTLGWVLQHDALGRRFGQGYDRKGAIAAYRRAKQLEPQDEEARADLAILLEHDAGGDRYATGTDLTAAIDEYKALRADLHADGMDDNLVVALLRAGRYQEMRDLLDKLEATPSRKILRLVATAVLDGPDAAVRDADRRFPDSKARLEALASAAQNLMILRRYPDAAALFDRASQQSPNAAEVLSLADLLRKTRRSEDLKISADEPAGVVKRLLQLFSSGALDAHSLAPLFTRDVAHELAAEKDEDVRQMLEAGFAPTRKRLRSNDIPVQTAMDMGFAAFRETVAGDDATGYRVKLVNTTNDGPRELVAFVVKEEGRYQILAFVNGLDVLGQEALRRLERGDLRAARQWLDWACEELAGQRSADDPLAVTPFVTLWAESSKEAGAGEMRCAAAGLMAEGSPAVKALPLLQACREAAEDPARKSVFDLALAHADRRLGRWADLAQVARRLLATSPTSEHAYGLAVLAAASLERWDDMRQVAEERLARLPADQLALRTLVDVKRQSGDYDGEEELLGKLIDSGQAQAGDFNNLAWLALVRGRVNEKAIEHAQRAANLSEYTSYSALHTLASLYAELGRTAEAYRIILQALGTKLDESPTSVDWYVFGRLAESYGLPDAARHYYERVVPGAAKTDPTSTYLLARKRLDALGPLGPATPPNTTKQARAGR